MILSLKNLLNSKIKVKYLQLEFVLVLRHQHFMIMNLYGNNWLILKLVREF